MLPPGLCAWPRRSPPKWDFSPARTAAVRPRRGSPPAPHGASGQHRWLSPAKRPLSPCRTESSSPGRRHNPPPGSPEWPATVRGSPPESNPAGAPRSRRDLWRFPEPGAAPDWSAPPWPVHPPPHTLPPAPARRRWRKAALPLPSTAAGGRWVPAPWGSSPFPQAALPDAAAEPPLRCPTFWAGRKHPDSGRRPPMPEGHPPRPARFLPPAWSEGSRPKPYPLPVWFAERIPKGCPQRKNPDHSFKKSSNPRLVPIFCSLSMA